MSDAAYYQTLAYNAWDGVGEEVCSWARDTVLSTGAGVVAIECDAESRPRKLYLEVSYPVEGRDEAVQLAMKAQDEMGQTQHGLSPVYYSELRSTRD